MSPDRRAAEVTVLLACSIGSGVVVRHSSTSTATGKNCRDPKVQRSSGSVASVRIKFECAEATTRTTTDVTDRAGRLVGAARGVLGSGNTEVAVESGSGTPIRTAQIESADFNVYSNSGFYSGSTVTTF